MVVALVIDHQKGSISFFMMYEIIGGAAGIAVLSLCQTGLLHADVTYASLPAYITWIVVNTLIGLSIVGVGVWMAHVLHIIPW